MKKIAKKTKNLRMIGILSVLFCMIVVPAYGQVKNDTSKILIVYFSYTGNTRALAEQIQEQTGGRLVEIVPVTPYSKDYDKVVEQGNKEVKAGFKPAIKTKIPDMASYGIIFIGSPIWWYTIAPPVSTFLSENNLKGKKIVPFITHGGYGLGHSIEDIKKLCPEAVLLKEYGIEGKQVNEIPSGATRWLKNLGLLRQK